MNAQHDERTNRIRGRVLASVARGARPRGPIKLGLLRRGYTDAEIDGAIDALVSEGKLQEFRAMDGKRRLRTPR